MNILTAISHDPILYARALWLLIATGGLALLFVILGYVADVLEHYFPEQ